jgi:hypothetical protein
MSGLEYRSGLITEYFKHYGYTPDPGVIEALVTSIGADNQEGIVSGEVGAFMNAVNQLNRAASSDPLVKILAQENQAIGTTGSDADVYAKELQDVYKTSPKLFGSLTPDQIDEYLAPLKSQFDYAEGKVQTDAAARGNTGSSLEANAMAQTGQQFKENVTKQGLDVGMQEQQNLAAVIQNLYNQKLQQQNLLYGLQQQTGGALSAQNYQNAQFLAQLPLLLNSYATQQMQLRNQQDANSGGWENIVGSLLGGGIGAMAGGPLGAMAGMQFGGAAANDITGRSMPTQTSAAMNNIPLLYGMSKGFGNGAPGGLNWANQPGTSVSGFNSTANGNAVWGPQGMTMLMGGNRNG